MKRDLHVFSNKTFDVLIIGGGITGACLAHDASLRGLNVALLEKADFGMSTSAASSKLLHGGIRYLQKFQFGKVRESARERCIFQVIAPHLTQYIPFLIPTIQGNFMKGAFAMKNGMFLYSLVCSGLNKLISDPIKIVPTGKFYTKNNAIKLVPLLTEIDDMSGAHTLFESHMHNSERMTLAFVKTAVSNGAQVANYVKVTRFLRNDDTITGVVCRDEIDEKKFEIHAKIVVNAAGPFISELNKTTQNLQLNKNTTGFSKGVHIVTKQICEDFALAIGSGKKTEGVATRGERHFFMIPWRGKSLIGTTNVPYDGDLDSLSVTEKDVTDFIADINDILPNMQLKKEDVHHAFTGLYPLVSEEIKTDTYQGTGAYQIVDHSKTDRVEGIVSVLGAKYTTGRIAAEKATDVILKKLGWQEKKCQTAYTKLLGGEITNLSDFIATKKKQYDGIFDADTIEYLISVHGNEIDTVIDYLSQKQPFSQKLAGDRETLAGEIHYAVEKEMSCTLFDMVFARTGLGTIGHPGTDTLLKVAEIMAEKIGWSNEKMAAEIANIEAQYSYLK